MPRALLLLLALGLLIRLVFVLAYERPLISDEREYHQLGSTLASTGRYEYNGALTAYRPVGYPMVVASIYFIAGEHPLAVKLTQCLLDVGTALLLFLILRMAKMRTRLLACGLWAVYVPAILYTNLLLTETLYTILLVFLVFLLSRGDQDQGWTPALMGLCIGFLTLIKPGSLLLLIPFVIYAQRMGMPLRALSVVAAVTLLSLAPWVIRNYVEFGRIALSSNGGINMLIGNNPNATGAYSVSFDPKILEGAHNEFEADAKAGKAAAEYIIEHPAKFVQNSVRKIAHLFESEGGLIVWMFHSDPEGSQTRFSQKYGSLSPWLILLVNLPYFAVMLVALPGFAVSEKNRFWWITLGLLCTWIVLHLVVFGGSRFHFPLMPFAVAFAALGFDGGVPGFSRLTRSQLLFTLLGGIAFISIWVTEAYAIFR